MTLLVVLQVLTTTQIQKKGEISANRFLRILGCLFMHELSVLQWIVDLLEGDAAFPALQLQEGIVDTSFLLFT